MAKKHFDKYFNDVCNQYEEMLDALHELEEEAQKGVVSPEKVENLKTLIAPLKNNWMTLSYVAYLLNQPQRDEKERPYQRRMKKFLTQHNYKDDNEVKEENKSCINMLKNSFK